MKVIRRISRHVMFHGRVQGVGFRAFVEQAANESALAGWVRNRRNGAVEAVLEGEAADVDAVIEACRKGPPSARVDRVDQREAMSDELALRGPETFAVLPTM
ncbi:MAG: acylphosphatase [Xanthobacteraceae bacterium]|nr:acylphosphatase [Xanthobacteraceae bacterium]